jgi:ABC-type amino acid transport substrate-binding protein
MKIYLRFIILFFATGNSFAQNSNYIKTSDSIIVMGDITFWPFEFINGNREADGIFVDLWKRIGELSGVKVIYKCENWNDAQNEVYAGKADALGSADKTPIRLSKLQYVGILHTLYIYVYYHNNLIGFKDLSSISKTIKVGLVKGDIAVDYVKSHYPNVSIQEFNNYETLVNAALADSLFVFAMEPPAAKYYFIHNNKLQSTFHQSNDYLMKETLYGAIRKDRPDLISKISIGFQKLTKAEKNKIFKKWNYLDEFSFWDKLKNICREYPMLIYIGYILALYVLLFMTWLLLYTITPTSLIGIFTAIKKAAAFKITFKGVTIQLPLTSIMLLDSFTFRRKVADKWIDINREAIKCNLNEIDTFKKRKIFSPSPLKSENKILNNSDASQLENEIKTELKEKLTLNGVVHICGEGGAGKTSLATKIALWAIEDKSFLGFYCIPIFIENDIEVVKDGANIPLFKVLNHLVERLLTKERGKKMEVDSKWLTFLLNKARIILIIDGLSELNENSKKIFSDFFNDYGTNSTVITSRNKEESILKDFNKSYLSPLRLNGVYISIFIDNILTLKKVRNQFNDIEFYNACKYLAGITGNRDVTILFAVLFIDVLINQKSNDNDPIGASSIAELVQIYIENINKRILEYEYKEIILVLKRLAWCIIKVELLPMAIKKDVVLTELASISDIDKKINYVVNKLKLINEFDPIIPKYKFSLDPISEYLAAVHVVEKAAMQDFEHIEHIKNYLEHNKMCIDDAIVSNEFLQALCDCCFSLDKSDLKSIQKDLFIERITEVFEEKIQKRLYDN